MGRHLAETTRLLGWRHANLVFALVALASALFAMALPGPSGDVTGFASVLIVGALALLAGHAWGILVIAASEVLILGKVWPIVSEIMTSGSPGLLYGTSATGALLFALPGVALFATTLPYTVEVVIGEKNSFGHRAGIVLSSFAATTWLAYPIL